ncbi:hypothetical protein CISIN_1g0202551mg, partial [Citrus sinensis]
IPMDLIRLTGRIVSRPLASRSSMELQNWGSHQGVLRFLMVLQLQKT